MKLPELKKRNLPSVKAVIVALVIGGVLAYLALTVYDRREAMLFAYSNPKATIQAKESFNKEIETAQTKYAENLSRSYIAN